MHKIDISADNSDTYSAFRWLNWIGHIIIKEVNIRGQKIDKPYVILLHCKEKADLLNLKYLGSIKICKEIMEKVAEERGLSNKLREQQTINNWNSCEGKIFETFEEIEKYCNKNM